jgi:hypothetical protein
MNFGAAAGLPINSSLASLIHQFGVRGEEILSGKFERQWIRATPAWQNNTGVKNFHLPLPEQTYAHLKAEAERMQVPATTLAREAVDSWLRQQARQARAEALAAYAAQMAGTAVDLNPALEAAGLHLLERTGR